LCSFVLYLLLLHEFFLRDNCVFEAFMYSDSFIDNVNIRSLFIFVIRHQHFQLQLSLFDEFDHMTREICDFVSSQSLVKLLSDVISSSRHHLRSFVRICMLQAQLQ
jgi:hypothetical protein